MLSIFSKIDELQNFRDIKESLYLLESPPCTLGRPYLLAEILLSITDRPLGISVHNVYIETNGVAV